MLRVIDTETCGLQGGVVEIASVDIVNGQIVNPMSDLVRPDRPISHQAMAIHRITEAMVADKPELEVVLPSYLGSPFYVAHNADFDSRMLPDMGGEWICTMKMARRLWNWPGIKYSNMGLYKARSLQVDTPPDLHHHRALYDCYITAALLLDIMQQTHWTPEEMVTITGRPTLMTTFKFGKYRGEAVSDVAERDPGYLRWMLKNIKEMTPQLRLTLKHYLGED
ncbi:exodeoxyribonuclease X [Atlantibacter subterraneus]|jgi:exodeoxyribonuclease X|uniref:Exodeoxyribonuclease X n=1 Tax=Atlantibacter subterraneus TaxID=255519 RepID=A0ABU4E411_9ENTR|nr:exodeoxyribonuclease X [Atlantibacter subterranea]MDV7023857.1 exodeoxyribonuclease X [Atlantibacter subterranea]MDW2744622.1 exodeoxyribonuclease X [Atlantibacter subterranea]MDZ5666953.1 exodeoxyribonuclease X [Atlantibacter hermannii]QFH71030.1 exodeoxyribonuclease X [Enterobacter sp. E76]